MDFVYTQPEDSDVLHSFPCLLWRDLYECVLGGDVSECVLELGCDGWCLQTADKEQC